jgi:hypothetical protein
MRFLSRLLVFGGVAIWLFAFVAWKLGVWITLPPAAARVLVLSLGTLGGAALVIAGTALSRAHRRSPVESERV